MTITKVTEDQRLIQEFVSDVEAIKHLLNTTKTINTLTKHGNASMENSIAANVMINSKQLQNNKNERTLTVSSIKENMLEFLKLSKNEQADVHGVQIIYSMALANIHNFIMLANMLIAIHWLILLNYVSVVTLRKRRG